MHDSKWAQCTRESVFITGCQGQCIAIIIPACIKIGRGFAPYFSRLACRAGALGDSFKDNCRQSVWPAQQTPHNINYTYYGGEQAFCGYVFHFQKSVSRSYAHKINYILSVRSTYWRPVTQWYAADNRCQQVPRPKVRRCTIFAMSFSVSNIWIETGGEGGIVASGVTEEEAPRPASQVYYWFQFHATVAQHTWCHRRVA